MGKELLKLSDPSVLNVDLNELTSESGRKEKKVQDGGGYDELFQRCSTVTYLDEVPPLHAHPGPLSNRRICR